MFCAAIGMILWGTAKGWPIVWPPTTNDAGKFNQCGPDLKCYILGMGKPFVQSFADTRLGQRHEDGWLAETSSEFTQDLHDNPQETKTTMFETSMLSL
jgi:hypothetical protein